MRLVEHNSTFSFLFTRDKWKDDDRVVFETEEEAIIAQNILEEMLG